MQKVQLILFPYKHQSWQRKVASMNEQEIVLQTPTEDINAPDLYIPLMAFITYTLLRAYASGISDSFHPEIIGMTASSSMVWLIIEIIAIKISLYVINASRYPALLEIVAMSMYKYVGFIVSINIGLLFGHTAFYIALFVFAVSQCVHFVKSMDESLHIDNSQMPNGMGAIGVGSMGSLGGGYGIDGPKTETFGTSRRRTMMLIFGLMQIVLAFIIAKGCLPTNAAAAAAASTSSGGWLGWIFGSSTPSTASTGAVASTQTTSSAASTAAAASASSAAAAGVADSVLAKPSLQPVTDALA
jgi:hypothetical protein